MFGDSLTRGNRDKVTYSVSKFHTLSPAPMQRLPSLNALRAFEAASRLLSFTLAAGELHVTHGAISKQIALLEQSLGVQLFLRHHQGLALTAPGARLASSVEAAFDILRAAAVEVTGVPDAIPLRISIPPTLVMWWLTPRLAALHRALPRLPIEISVSTGPINFAANAYDAAIRRVDAAPKGMFVTSFLDGRSVPVCSPRYKKCHQIRSRADLANATLIVLRSEPTSWFDWLRAHKVRRNLAVPELTFDFLYFAIQAALDSLGVALVPFVLVEKAVEQGKLCVVDRSGFSGERTYALVSPQRSARQAHITAIANWLVDEGGGTDIR